MDSSFELVNILEDAKKLLSIPENDFSWSTWDNADAALNEIDSQIKIIKTGEKFDVSDLTVFFAPTGDIQEVSMSSGWGDIFLKLADRFDKAIKSYR